MKYILYSVCLFCSFDFALNQYVNQIRMPSKTNSCENPSNTALIEHFFNIIFSEFYNTPPVCVCVQMCIDQPTYCYPNGCLKKEDNKNKQMNNMQSIPHGLGAEKQSMLVVDEKNDFMTNFLKKIDVAEPKIGKKEINSFNDMRPDPFKDKYKMFIKYKKRPKVQLSYNLREQVRNMKSDILKIETLDVSKTRWPMNKDKRVNQQRIYTPTNSNTFYVSVYPGNNASSSKYFKRDLTNKSDNRDDINVVDQKGAALNDTDFSLETLIDNLIEGNFVRNETDVNLKEIYNNDVINEQSGNVIAGDNSKNELSTTTSATTIEDKEFVNESTIVNSQNFTNLNTITLNETNDIVVDSKNTENILSGDKYSDGKFERNTDTFNNFNEIITTLAKQIEKQNNTSMEIMKRIIGDTQIIDNVTQKFETDQINDYTTDVISDTTVTSKFEDINGIELETQHSELKTLKRNRKRLRRKMENSKLN